jgi:hypothetical protein
VAANAIRNAGSKRYAVDSDFILSFFLSLFLLFVLGLHFFIEFFCPSCILPVPNAPVPYNTFPKTFPHGNSKSHG